MVLRSRLHVSQEFLDQLRTLRINNRNDLYSTLQFVRDFYPNKSQEDIRRIFEIQTQTQFQGRIPEVSGNMSVQQGSGQVATNAQVTTQAIFVTDPYKADINPATDSGQKLFLKATAELDEKKKFDMIMDNSQKFIDLVTTDAQSFGWGELVYGIPVSISGTTVGTKNMLDKYAEITLDMILSQAYRTWGSKTATVADPVPNDHVICDLDAASDQDDKKTFFRRVKSRMIAKRIKGYLKLSDWNTLKNQADKFTWTSAEGDEYDGPTMLWILINVVNPEIKVTVNDLKKQITTARSKMFGHNIKKLTDFMSTKLREIKEKGGSHEDFLLHLYEALESVPNDDFKAEIRTSRREWEKGAKTDPDTVILNAVKLYNNKNVPGNQTWTHKDPKDAKIIALTTKLEQLTKVFASALDGDSGGAAAFTTTNQNKGKIDIEDWRKKKGAASVERGGKTWHWCPHHKFPGQFDGLYVTHPPSEHDKWKARKDEERKKRSSGKTDNTKKSGDGTKKQRLTLSNNLKAALSTCGNLTGAQAKALVKEFKDAYDSEDF